MKQIIFCFLLFIISVACTKDSDRTSVAITETNDGSYELTAAYNTSKTLRVQQAINNLLNPKTIFTSEREKVETVVKLADGTHFFIKASAGNLFIKFDKRENSNTAFLKIKKLYADISEAAK